jgi:hypothetical protein
MKYDENHYITAIQQNFKKDYRNSQIIIFDNGILQWRRTV